MYVEILSGALDTWTVDLVDDDALVDYVLSCRSVLPERDLGAGTWSDVALVAEVSYDRALITLAASRGIDVAPTNFMHPRIERERLESALAEVGVDLDELASHPRRITQHEADEGGQEEDEDGAS